MSKPSTKFKQGATSIYVVVISMLLLLVITVSFVRIAVTEAQRTAGDELSQSSYDSALAGIEDAKLALKQYYNCKNSNPVQNADGDDLCPGIIDAIDKGFANPDSYCDAISTALDRIAEGMEVPIQESAEAENNFEQAYTCVMIDDSLEDYRRRLTSSNPMHAIALSAEDVSSITGIRISWYSTDDGSIIDLNYPPENYLPQNQPAASTPPVISAHIVQTAPNFTLEQFDEIDLANGRTNNATVVLKPVQNGVNHVLSSTLVKSNDHQPTNEAQKITCGPHNGLSDEFACVASLALPKPIGSDVRRKDTFYLFLSLPYEQPNTTFSVQLCTDTDAVRGNCMLESSHELSVAPFYDSQIAIDSTGRANNMYTRVEARLEFNDISAPLPQHALYSMDQSGGIDKNFYVTLGCWSQRADWTAELCDNYGVK